MLLPGQLREAVLRAADEAWPDEACGLLGGTGEELRTFIPCRNALQSPIRYAIAPEEVLAALKMFARQGLELKAIFHAHPAGPARPSPTDIREAAYPGVLHLILGAAPQRELRGYFIEAGQVREEKLRTQA